MALAVCRQQSPAAPTTEDTIRIVHAGARTDRRAVEIHPAHAAGESGVDSRHRLDRLPIGAVGHYECRTKSPAERAVLQDQWLEGPPRIAPRSGDLPVGRKTGGGGDDDFQTVLSGAGGGHAHRRPRGGVAELLHGPLPAPAPKTSGRHSPTRTVPSGRACSTISAVPLHRRPDSGRTGCGRPDRYGPDRYGPDGYGPDGYGQGRYGQGSDPAGHA